MIGLRKVHSAPELSSVLHSYHGNKKHGNINPDTLFSVNRAVYTETHMRSASLPSTSHALNNLIKFEGLETPIFQQKPSEKGKPFGPINHDRTEIRWKKASKEDQQLAVIILGQTKLPKAILIESLDETGIASNNYRISFESSPSLILRMNSRITNIDDHTAIADVLDQLSRSNESIDFPVYLSLFNDSSDPRFLVHINKLWTAHSIVPSDRYFSGGSEELTAAGKTIGGIHFELEKLSPCTERSSFYTQYVYGEDVLLQTKEILEEIQALPDIDRDEYATCFIQYSAGILNAIKIVTAFNEKNTISEFPAQRLHYDLHPHNVLSYGNGDSLKVGVVDFEHVNTTSGPIQLDIGFALHRLVRQTIVHAENPPTSAQIAKWANDFLLGYKEANPEGIFEKSDLYAFTIYRALKNVLLLLNDYVKPDGQRTKEEWWFDIPKQCANLVEIKIIYDALAASRP